MSIPKDRDVMDVVRHARFCVQNMKLTHELLEAVESLDKHMRFEIQNRPEFKFQELGEAAQEAEFLAARDKKPYCVVALNDELPYFSKGEIVYESSNETP